MSMLDIQVVKSTVNEEEGVAEANAVAPGHVTGIVTGSGADAAPALVRVTANEAEGRALAPASSVSAPDHVTASVAGLAPRSALRGGVIGVIGIARINRMNGVRLGLKTSRKTTTMTTTTDRGKKATAIITMLKSRLSRIRKITSPSAPMGLTWGIEVICRAINLKSGLTKQQICAWKLCITNKTSSSFSAASRAKNCSFFFAVKQLEIQGPLFHE